MIEMGMGEKHRSGTALAIGIDEAPYRVGAAIDQQKRGTSAFQDTCRGAKLGRVGIAHPEKPHCQS